MPAWVSYFEPRSDREGSLGKDDGYGDAKQIFWPGTSQGLTLAPENRITLGEQPYNELDSFRVKDHIQYLKLGRVYCHMLTDNPNPASARHTW